MAFEWLDIPKFAVPTGLVVAVMNFGLTWFKDQHNDKTTAERDAKYLALRLAVIFEKFAIECAGAITCDSLYDEFGGHAGCPNTGIPTLLDYPADADWKALDAALSAKALSFWNDILQGKQSIGFMWDYDPGSVSLECNEQCGKCGSRAWALASELRRRYRLPSFDHTASWDFLSTLKKQTDRVEKRAREQKATGT